MPMNKKKTIKICVIIVLILIAGISIFFGVYFNKLTKPKYIYGVGIDRLDNKITNYVKLDEKYNLGDSISITSELDFDLDSEEYLKKSKTDKEYLEKYKTIKNLTLSTNNISIMQDEKNKKALLEIHSLLGKDKLLDYKYLIENATGYYYVEDILNKYVNAGTSNYFEMFNDNSTTAENMEYLHGAIIKALKNNLEDEYFEKYAVSENIHGSKVNVNQISIKIDDKKLHKILNGMISDLKEDTRANKILTSIDKDFSKYKIKTNESILEKQESYTINIYTSKYRNIALKYEVVHLKGDEKNTYSYEGDINNGDFYYIEDDTVIYAVKLSDDGNIIEGKINDSTNNEIGTIKIEKNDTGKYFTFNFDDGEKKYDVIYSSKSADLKEHKSYTNEKQLSFKYLNNKVSVLSGEVTLKSKISSKAKIDESVTDAVLSSTLNDETKNKYDNKLENIKERLKK